MLNKENIYDLEKLVDNKIEQYNYDNINTNNLINKFLIIKDINCKNKQLIQKLKNNYCPIYYFNNVDLIDKCKMLNTEQEIVNSADANIKFIITDNKDEIKDLILNPFLDIFIRKKLTANKEKDYLNKYLKIKLIQYSYLTEIEKLRLGIGYISELENNLDIMIDAVGKANHLSINTINKYKEYISDISKKDFKYSINDIEQRLLNDPNVAKFNNKIWFYSPSRKWQNDKEAKNNWIIQNLLNNTKDDVLTVNFIKNNEDKINIAIKNILDSTKIKDNKEEGLFDKDGYYYKLYNDNKFYLKIYDNEFTLNSSKLDFENVINANEEEKQKVNLFLDYLTNNNQKVKDSLLKIFASILIDDPKLRKELTPCLVLYGPSNTGKSTLINLLQNAIGNRCLDTKTVKLNKTQLFNLVGKRCLILDDAPEFNYQDTIINHNVGSMLGGFVNGDNFHVKELYQQDTTVNLQLMPIIITNYKPQIETVNMKRRTIFIKLDHDIDNSKKYKDIINQEEIDSSEFIEAFMSILIDKLEEILNEKELNKMSKNDLFNYIYNVKELNQLFNSSLEGAWPEDLLNMFYSLNITNINQLIGIKQTELYQYYLNNNFGNRNLTDFIKQFNINELTFKRLSFTINKQRILTTMCLSYLNTKKQHKIIKRMKDKVNVIYVDKNGEKHNEMYAETRGSIQNYDLKNVRRIVNNI